MEPNQVERVAEALYLANGGTREGSLPFDKSYDYTKAIYRVMATAAISAMPDSYTLGWNAAIDELERQDGFGEWAEAAKFLRTLRPPVNKPPIL